MIFSDKIYPKPVAGMILDGGKTQTRRLVKEHEITIASMSDGIIAVECNGKVKWQVGRDYAVQLGRGRSGLWYCPKCRETYKEITAEDYNEYGPPLCNCSGFSQFTESLRFKITSIRKECLLDISEEDARKEGFKNRYEFWQVFDKINNLKTKEDHDFPNLDVWVIDFEVKGK